MVFNISGQKKCKIHGHFSECVFPNITNSEKFFSEKKIRLLFSENDFPKILILFRNGSLFPVLSLILSVPFKGKGRVKGPEIILSFVFFFVSFIF